MAIKRGEEFEAYHMTTFVVHAGIWARRKISIVHSRTTSVYLGCVSCKTMKAVSFVEKESGRGPVNSATPVPNSIK